MIETIDLTRITSPKGTITVTIRMEFQKEDA
jgi:hypothetical protein